MATKEIPIKFVISAEYKQTGAESAMSGGGGSKKRSFDSDINELVGSDISFADKIIKVLRLIMNDILLTAIMSITGLAKEIGVMVLAVIGSIFAGSWLYDKLMGFKDANLTQPTGVSGGTSNTNVDVEITGDFPDKTSVLDEIGDTFNSYMCSMVGKSEWKKIFPEQETSTSTMSSLPKLTPFEQLALGGTTTTPVDLGLGGSTKNPFDIDISKITVPKSSAYDTAGTITNGILTDGTDINMKLKSDTSSYTSGMSTIESSTKGTISNISSSITSATSTETTNVTNLANNGYNVLNNKLLECIKNIKYIHSLQGDVSSLQSEYSSAQSALSSAKSNAAKTTTITDNKGNVVGYDTGSQSVYVVNKQTTASSTPKYTGPSILDLGNQNSLMCQAR
jgi:hypothetical protein